MSGVITDSTDVKRLTNGPKHHLFGFHDLLISNTDDSKYLSIEVDTINRPPLPGELFGVGYVEDAHFVKVGETSALNYPQGARQQWVARTNCFVVNNRVGNVWGTDLYDADLNRLADRFDTPTHMLSRDGRYSYGLDYARLFRLGGYGYSGIADAFESDPAPFNAGITVLDLKTKVGKVLISVREVAEFVSNGRLSGVSHHYLTHLCLNPSSTRIAFLHRYFMGDGGMMTRLMTIGTDGSNLRCLAQGYLSHFDWKDDNHIYIFGRANNAVDSLRNNRLFSNPIVSPVLRFAKNTAKVMMGKKGKSMTSSMSFLMIEDADSPEITPFAKGIILSDGHPMVCPSNSDWFICDTYPDEERYRDLFLYCFSTEMRVNIGRFRMIDDRPDLSLSSQFFKGVDSKILSSISPDNLAFTRSGLHCDLHPRWNSKGTKAVFDSIHEGTRQIYLADVERLIH